MQPEVKKDAALPSVGDPAEEETRADSMDEYVVQNAGPAGLATRVFLSGSEMAVGGVRKREPFFC